MSLHLTHVPGQPSAGLGQLFNAAVKRAQTCAMRTWEPGASVGVICCTLAGHQKEEVGEQGLMPHGERICLWKGRRLNVLFHPQGFGLFQDTVIYMPFVIQLAPSLPPKKGSRQKQHVCYN